MQLPVRDEAQPGDANKLSLFATPANPTRKRLDIRKLARSLLINAALPWLIYKAKTQYAHTKELYALGATSIPSLLDAIYSVAKYRKINFLAGFTLFTVAVSLGLVALGGSPKLYLVRESLFTGAVGVAMVVSLTFRRPALYIMMRYFLSGNDSARADAFDRDWGGAEGLHLTRVMTGTMGVVFVVEIAVRVYMAYHLPTGRFLAYSPFVFYGSGAAMVIALRGYTSRDKRLRPNSVLMEKLKGQRAQWIGGSASKKV